MCVCVCVCVCVCACMHVIYGHIFCLFSTKVSIDSGHAKEKVCVKSSNIMHQVNSRRVDPHIKFLDDANATPSSSFEHTPTPVLQRLYVSPSFAMLPAIKDFLPIDLIYSSCACISLQILIAFPPNPIYMFLAPRAITDSPSSEHYYLLCPIRRMGHASTYVICCLLVSTALIFKRLHRCAIISHDLHQNGGQRGVLF